MRVVRICRHIGMGTSDLYRVTVRQLKKRMRRIPNTIVSDIPVIGPMGRHNAIPNPRTATALQNTAPGELRSALLERAINGILIPLRTSICSRANWIFWILF